ncbi:MAG: hypothetical protein ACI8QW_001025 [Saprospiraceae bacterium]|jgi:hypothetical protein
MKTIYTLVLSFFIGMSAFSQDFEWAQLIDFPNANEVGGLDVNSVGDVFMTGVFSSDFSLPYDGDSYLIKTDSGGSELWTKIIGSEIVIGDLVCTGEDVVVVGHSYDVIQCDGAVLLGSFDGSSMFMIKINSDGTIGWLNSYPNRHGQFAHLDYDDGIIALQCSGAFNSGNHIMHFDTDGNEINDLQIDDYNINEIAYYEGKTYVTGGTSFGQALQIDNVDIPAPETESLNFVLAFDENYIAQWGHAGNALNSTDNQIVAGEAGIFSYQSILLSETFTFTSKVWKFDVNGTLLEEVTPPVFTNAISLYPDLDLSDCHLSLFAQNDFSFDNHELILFDHDLLVIDEKEVNGNSNLYSGKVASHENQIYISHVHIDNLDFNDEVEIIDLLDDAIQYPYLAKVAVSELCGEVMLGDCGINNVIVEQHDCINGEFMIDFEFYSENVSDSFYVSGNGMNYGSFAYGQTFYTIGAFAGDGSSVYELIITDFENNDCSTFIEFGALDCPIGDCFIDDIEVFDFYCDTDSTYSMVFNAEISDPGNEFIDVWVNNEFWAFYEISALPITISGITPGESDYDIIQICVNDNELCCAVTEYMVPNCLDEEACSVSDLEVFDFYCDTDSTYSMVFNAEISDPGNEFIDVWVNNEFWAFYEISALPITISGITPRESDYDIIQICVNDNELCCAAIEYMAPDCLVDHIQEVEEGFSIYPNPVSETLFIQSDSSLINPRVVIYDSVGKEVLVHSGITSPLSVSMLASGVYQLAIFEGEKRVLITEIIKR